MFHLTSLQPSSVAEVHSFNNIHGYLTIVKQFISVQKKTDAAKLHILAACQSPYGQRSVFIKCQHFSVMLLYSEINLIASPSISGLMIIWLHLPGFTVFVEIGVRTEIFGSCLKLLSSPLWLFS